MCNVLDKLPNMISYPSVANTLKYKPTWTDIYLIVVITINASFHKHQVTLKVGSRSVKHYLEILYLTDIQLNF